MTERPPIPGAKRGSDGSWYIRHRGRWHLLEQKTKPHLFEIREETRI